MSYDNWKTTVPDDDNDDDNDDDYMDYSDDDSDDAPDDSQLPIVKLSGRDGNAFAIMGACQRAARQAGWSAEQINLVMNEMTAGDYDHLLQTAMKNFDVR
jgi:hypothetical protein